VIIQFRLRDGALTRIVAWVSIMGIEGFYDWYDFRSEMSLLKLLACFVASLSVLFTRLYPTKKSDNKIMKHIQQLVFAGRHRPNY